MPPLTPSLSSGWGAGRSESGEGGREKGKLGLVCKMENNLNKNKKDVSHTKKELLISYNPFCKLVL